MSQSPPNRSSGPLEHWNSTEEPTLPDRLLALQIVPARHHGLAEVNTPLQEASLDPPQSRSSTVRAHSPSTMRTLSTKGAPSTVVDGNIADGNAIEIPACDWENDSVGSPPSLSKSSTVTDSEYSISTSIAPLPARNNLLHPQTNEIPEGHDGKARVCMFWFLGCTNRFITCKAWFKCSRNHMMNIQKPPLQPPRKVVCKGCSNFKPGGATIWDAWQSALQHMWDEHVEVGDLNTLFGDTKTDQAFVRWLHSKRIICDADFKALSRNPFSTETNPVTRTERTRDRRGGR